MRMYLLKTVIILGIHRAREVRFRRYNLVWVRAIVRPCHRIRPTYCTRRKVSPHLSTAEFLRAQSFDNMADTKKW